MLKTGDIVKFKEGNSRLVLEHLEHFDKNNLYILICSWKNFFKVFDLKKHKISRWQFGPGWFEKVSK